MSYRQAYCIFAVPKHYFYLLNQAFLGAMPHKIFTLFSIILKVLCTHNLTKTAKLTDFAVVVFKL